MVVLEQKRVSTTISIVVGEWRDGFVLAPVVDEVIVVEMGWGRCVVEQCLGPGPGVQCLGFRARAQGQGSVFRAYIVY